MGGLSSEFDAGQVPFPRNSSFRNSRSRQSGSRSVNFVAEDDEEPRASSRERDEFADEAAEAFVEEYLMYTGNEFVSTGRTITNYAMSDDDEDDDY